MSEEWQVASGASNGNSLPAKLQTCNLQPGTLATCLSVALIFVCYLAFAISYGIINPLFEAPDEHHHYFTAVYIAQHWQLPAVASDDSYDQKMRQEAAQPPLYYLLGAGIIAPTGAKFNDDLWENPFVQMGDASALNNRNRFVHTPAESFPWQGLALSAHLLRLFSTILGLGTLLAIYATAGILWQNDPRPALLGVGVVALNPAFLFLHASVSNDPLIIFLSSVALWQMAVWWGGEVTKPRLLLLGVTVGLAMLSKNAGILLLLLICFGLFWRGWRRGERWLGQVAWAIVPAIAIAGWLFIRNFALYGDPTATNQFVRLAGGDRDATLGQIGRELPGILTSLAGLFGWFNVRLPDWVYWLWSGLAGAAIAGICWQLAKKPRWNSRTELGLLYLGWIGLVFVGMVAFMLRTPAGQGRLLLPAILPIGLGVGAGLSSFGRAGWLALAVALLTAWIGLFWSIPQAYHLPHISSETAGAPPGTELVDGLFLLGGALSPANVEAGDVVMAAISWRADKRLAEPPEIVYLLRGREGEIAGRLQSYHGNGLYPATLWGQNETVMEEVRLQLAQEMTTPALVTLLVSVADGEWVKVGQVKVAGNPIELSSGHPIAQFDGKIELRSANISPKQAVAGNFVTVSLEWGVLAPIEQSLTQFVHLGDPNSPPLAQGDAPPFAGSYPTDVWGVGEILADEYSLQLPADLLPSAYPIYVGWYDRETGERMPAFSAGDPLPNDAVLVGWVEAISE